MAVDHVNDLGWTALLETVILGDGSSKYVQIVQSLIAHRADLFLGDRQGVTPLAHALQRNQQEVAALLKGAGALTIKP